jgi:hypothetical protein
MKMKFINKAYQDEPVMSMGFMVKTGDVVDTSAYGERADSFIQKMKSTKNWEETDDSVTVTALDGEDDPETQATTKKRGLLHKGK